MNRVLKIGLIALGASVGIMLLLLVLTPFGVAQFGPCGTDLLGMALFFAFLIAGVIGVSGTTAGLLEFGFRKLWPR